MTAPLVIALVALLAVVVVIGVSRPVRRRLERWGGFSDTPGGWAGSTGDGGHYDGDGGGGGGGGDGGGGG